MNVTQTNWFATPVWEIQTELALGKLRSTVKSIRKKDPEGVIFTNVGGWQSNSYPNVCSKYEEDYDIKEPMTPVIEFLNNMADSCATQMGVPNFTIIVGLLFLVSCIYWCLMINAVVLHSIVQMMNLSTFYQNTWLSAIR